jgi:pimeloyl-ACP methyl ester carboxylesterase
MKQMFFRSLSIALAAAAVMAVYFGVVRDVIWPVHPPQIEFVLFGALALAVLTGFLLAILPVIGAVFSKNRVVSYNTRLGHMIFLFTAVFLLIVFVAASQWAAHTPPILGEDGKPLPGSIASLEKIRLGGVDQWLIIRGQDVNKPVLLFLSGGPGASEAARVLRFNQELEKHFVVVIWEQRGCGKSYPARSPKSALTVSTYTSDIIELAELLRARFDEEKIYLVGHSWGTIIGVQAAQARPDLFHAYIGTAQMVDVLETDQMIYQMMMAYSRQTGDTAFVRTLEKQGAPPYLGKSPIRPYSTLFGREYAVYEFPNIKNEAYRRDGDILMLMLRQPEYGWLDRIYYLLGLMNTFNAVYPQLQDMDYRLDATHFDLPVYLILGRHDMNNPSRIPEEYFDLLTAPSKQLYFFESSGHGMIWEEAGLFHEILINTVLPETLAARMAPALTPDWNKPSAEFVAAELETK